MVFVETPPFTRLLGDYLNDDEYRELQQYLLENPQTGSVIQGTGGVRKMRWSAKGQGKSGGVRVIYFCHVERDRIVLLTLYAKNEASDLTADQRKKLAAIVERFKL